MSESGQKPEGFDDYLKRVEEKAAQGVSGIIGDVEDRILDEEMRQIDFDYRQPGKHFAELQSWVAKEDLEQLLPHLEGINTDDFQGAFDYAAFAADLKEFDPQWFKKNCHSVWPRWHELMEALYIVKDSPLKFVEYAGNLKTLNFQEFSRDVKINSEMWDKIAQALNERIYIWHSFIKAYAQAAFLDYREIVSRLNIDEYWDEIRDKLDSHFANSLSYADMVAAAQSVKPNGRAKIGFTAKNWLGCQYDLYALLKSYKDSGDWKSLKSFIAFARDLKYLRVDEPQGQKNT